MVEIVGDKNWEKYWKLLKDKLLTFLAIKNGKKWKYHQGITAINRLDKSIDSFMDNNLEFMWCQSHSTELNSIENFWGIF